MIDEVKKSYVAKDEYIKYLGVPLRSRKISKKKFLEAKINKVYEELGKLEFSGLAFNQVFKTIRKFITNNMYYLFANMDVPDTVLNKLDSRIRRVINNFIGGQSIQKSFIYANVRNGGLGIPCMIDEYDAYKVNLFANLMSYEEDKKILIGYNEMKSKITKNQDLIVALEKSLKRLNIIWQDWEDFKLQGINWEWRSDEKENGRESFNFVDLVSQHKYKGKVENIHKSLIG
jgi:hypothetical protein